MVEDDIEVKDNDMGELHHIRLSHLSSSDFGVLRTMIGRITNHKVLAMYD